VDQSGSTHYTTTPPPKGAKRLNKVSTYGSQPLLKNPTSNSEQPSQDKDKVVQEVTNVAVEKVHLLSRSHLPRLYRHQIIKMRVVNIFTTLRLFKINKNRLGNFITQIKR
jgi:hypothetical protein